MEGTRKIVLKKTVVLGDEFDDDLKVRLVEKMKSLGAKPLSSDWSVAGSQELSALSVSLRGDVLTIQSETFVGLSICGPEDLVDEISLSIGAIHGAP